MKKLLNNLLFRVILAILLGICCGMFFPKPLSRIFVTFNGLFGNFLSFIVPLIILGLVAPGLTGLGKSSGKWLFFTTAIAYISTIFSGFMTLLVAYYSYPHLLASQVNLQVLKNPEDAFLKGFFTIEMPPMLNVTSALLFAFIIGIGLAYVNNNSLHNCLYGFRDIIMATIEKIIIPLLPLHIFGIFLNITTTGQVASVITTVIKVIVLVFVLHIFLLILQYCVAALFDRSINPFVALKNMLPAYFTALGTSSSAATIPVSLRQAKTNGVSDSVANFVIPLCATIHLAGSMMKITAFALAVMFISNTPINIVHFIGFMFMLAITMVAAPGVPGGAIMAAIGVLQSMLGFNEPMIAFMIATYIAIDSFGTACNVTGDGAIAIIINKLSKSDRKKYDEKTILQPENVEVSN